MRRIGGSTCERASNANALALAAGKFVRLPAGEFPRVEPYKHQEVIHAGGGSGPHPIFRG